MRKTAFINVAVEPEVKKKLKEKARELGLSLTCYLEKIATERIIFIDKNIRNLMAMLKFSTN